MNAYRLWRSTPLPWLLLATGTAANCGWQDEDQHCLLQSSRSEQGFGEDPKWDIPTLNPSAPKWRRKSRDLEVQQRGEESLHFHSHIFRELGCWPLDPSDDVGRADARFHDRACVDYKGSGRCRSGFPFFRFAMPEGADSLECARFCVSKGLDMAGILDIGKKGFECRCGASIANAAAWQRRPPRLTQLLDLKAKVDTDSPDCKILVFRYSGHFEHGGIPMLHMGISGADMDYMVLVARGKPEDGVYGTHNSVDSNEVQKAEDKGSVGKQTSGRTEIGELLTPSERNSIEQKSQNAVHNTKAAAMLQANRSDFARMMCADDPAPAITVGGRTHTCQQMMILCHRPDTVGSQVTSACPFTCGLCSDRDAWTPCFPKACASGTPWLTQDPDGNFLIPYVFDENVDRVRRDAFAVATKAWEEDTCIRFQLGGTAPRIRVVLEDFSTCYSEIGYPGPSGETKINLGSCNSQRSVGNMIHELGHSLGMTHEHRRPDAGSRIWLADEKRYVGPYLIFHWENIPPNVRAQYVPDIAAYTGSSHQGEGDVQSGYNPYDYGSIMHYSRMNNRFEAAKNPAYNNNMGQRNHPSQGDFKQLRDMYQCGGKTRHASRSKYEKTSLWYWMGYDESDVARWSTGVFGSCVREEGEEHCYRSRTVHCLGMHGEMVSLDACPADKRPKAHEACACSTACEDKYPTGISERGVQFGCWQLSNDCYNTNHSQAVREACPVTCNICGTPNKGVSQLSCQDLAPTSLIRPAGAEKDLSCQDLAAQGACHSEIGASVQFRCPRSCGVCPAVETEAAACKDDSRFQDALGYGCLAYIGYDCPGAVLDACPKSCGSC